MQNEGMAEAEPRGQHNEGAAAPPQQGLLDELKALISALRSLVQDHVQVAALETRQAGESLVRIIAMGLIATFLVFTAWLALVGAAVLLLIQHTVVAPSIALLLVALVHAAVTLGLVFAIRGQSRHLLFPTVVKNLNPATEPPDPERNS